jgi:hypothetical protein
MRELMSLLSKGAHVVQAFQPPWEGGRAREVFYLQHGEKKRAVKLRLVVQAMRSERLVVDDEPCDGVSPRIWRFVQKRRA